jgi:beta-galactosidase
MMFDKNFKFGFSECGFQFEMGLSGEDKNSDWYVWANNKRNEMNHDVSGDPPQNGVAYWDMYRIDHENARNLGMDAGRLGIEWSRIFPESTENINAGSVIENGDVKKVTITMDMLEKMDKIANQDAISHYSDIFLDFKSRGNFLIINLYHWAIPLWLNNPDKNAGKSLCNCFDNRIIIEFAKYAAFAAWKFDRYADRWCTINEPNMVYQGCSTDHSLKNIILKKRKFAEGHARAYDSIKYISNKPVGIIFANGDIMPFAEKDYEASEHAKYINRYSFFDSIIKGNCEGITPDGQARNLRDDLMNRVDWLGLNYYSRDVVEKTDDEYGFKIVMGYGHYCPGMETSKDGNPVSDTGWEIYPEGIYNIIRDYYNRYRIPITITENGLADEADKFRSYYISSHLSNVERAIKDGFEVEGYFHWALTDNFEWASGFSKKFGLFSVNMDTKERKMRESALTLKKIIESRETAPLE